MMKKRKAGLIAEPLLHIIIAITGLSLIIFLPDSDSVCEQYERLVSTLIDIGIGLFPTGLIGLIMVFLQKSQNNNEKYQQRISLMKELNIKLHNILNAICSTSHSSNDKVQRILSDICVNALSDDLNENIKSCSREFSNVIEVFLCNETGFLLSEMFTTTELEALNILAKSLDVVANTNEEVSSSQKERDLKNMVGCVAKLLKLFPEFSSYMKSTFRSGNIQCGYGGNV